MRRATILFVLTALMPAVQPQISKGPTNALKRTGDRITLNCFTNNRDCTLLDWQKVEGRQSPKIVYRNGVGMIKNELFPTERYNVTEGFGCNLTIKQLKVNDSGRYVCVLTMPGGTEDTKSSVLFVVDATEKCVSNLTNKPAKGNGYTVSCAIKMPHKTLEPTDVMLMMDAQLGTVDTADPNMDIRATLAAKVTQSEVKHVCKASFEPLSKDGYDITSASLEVCIFNHSVKIECPGSRLGFGVLIGLSSAIVLTLVTFGALIHFRWIECRQKRVKRSVGKEESAHESLGEVKEEHEYQALDQRRKAN